MDPKRHLVILKQCDRIPQRLSTSKSLKILLLKKFTFLWLIFFFIQNVKLTQVYQTDYKFKI